MALCLAFSRGLGYAAARSRSESQRVVGPWAARRGKRGIAVLSPISIAPTMDFSMALRYSRFSRMSQTWFSAA
jgi:hypothetical protein